MAFHTGNGSEERGKQVLRAGCQVLDAKHVLHARCRVLRAQCWVRKVKVNPSMALKVGTIRNRNASSQHSALSTRYLFPGFTLIELIVVMAIIALLLTIAVPRYWHSTDKAKEAVLKQDLAQMRVAIDQYHADRGKYPDRLEDLVDRKYLRTIPPDPLTESNTTWMIVPPPDPGSGSVYDVKSGASGTAIDGRNYREW
jgi:general secretion pathway protein G